MDDTLHELRQVRHEIRELHGDLVAALLVALINLDPTERHFIMSALDDLKLLGARIDAVTASLPGDVATAVAAQKSADDAANAATVQALADANAAATQQETQLQAVVTDLTAKIVALETAAGIPAATPVSPPPPPPVLQPIAWDSGKTYNTGDAAVGSDNQTYSSAVDGNLDNDPTTSPSSLWTVVA